MDKGSPPAPFRLLRFFSLASLAGVVASAWIVLAMHRSISISTITELGESVNIALARIALETIHDPLAVFLKTVNDSPKTNRISPEFPPELLKRIHSLVHQTVIARIKIYDRHGTVVYSSKRSQIGRNQANNAGFTAAMLGRPASKLVYRDFFNFFDKEHDDANLIQSYLPVYASPTLPALGVLEIYTNVDHLAVQTERSEIAIISASVGVFLVLYLLLIMIIRRAEILIQHQDDIIRERSQTLEILSAQLLTSQEQERKLLADVLHEGVAQTLSGIKLRLESAFLGRNQNPDDVRNIEELNDHIRYAIQEVRTQAMRIRPSSLDDFGLIQTLDWLLRDFTALNPELNIRTQIRASENQIPQPLKPIIFRIMQDTLNNLAHDGVTENLAIALSEKDNVIELRVDECCVSVPDHAANEGAEPTQGSTFGFMQERTVLSGGEYWQDKTPEGTVHHCANWKV